MKADLHGGHVLDRHLLRVVVADQGLRDGLDQLDAALAADVPLEPLGKLHHRFGLNIYSRTELVSL